MKKFLLGTAVLMALGMASQASAADLAARSYTKAPPMMAAVYDWTGFYVGGQVGYDWRRDRNTERFLATGVADGFRADSSPRGIVGGLHAGYNWQTSMFVYGLEADVEGADIKRTANYRFLGGAPIADHIDSKTDFQGSLRGRLGFSASNWLFYATGGLAWADFKHTYVTGVAGPPVNSFSTTRVGYTAGAGVEYGFSPNWSGRVEYRYSDYGTFTNNVGTQFIGAVQDQKITDNSVRAGVSYRWGGPVVAKY